MSYLTLSDELRIDTERATKIVQQCKIGNGQVLYNAEDGYPIYRFFSRLVEGCMLPVRKAISFSLTPSSGKFTSATVFTRYTGMRENLMTVANNLSEVIFPTKLEYGLIHSLNLCGAVYSGDVNWKAHNHVISALNNVYLFSSSEPVDIYLQSHETTGIQSVRSNAQCMRFEGHTPIQSIHALWGHVRFYWVNGEIRYKLSGISDTDFCTLLSTYIFPSGRIVTESESIEDISYKSPGYWMECVQQMQQDLDFSPADKRGWTAIKRTFRDIKTLEDFENAVHCGSLTDSANNLSTINLVSYDFAFRLLEYFSIKFKRRMS